jgi:V/A-type H+-transporting ATPase subunit I
MAVVPMQKVRVAVHQSDVDALMLILQRAKAMEFRATTISDTEVPSIDFPHAELFARVHHAVAFLKPYEPKRSLWRTLRDGSQTSFTEAQLQKMMSDTDAVQSVVTDLEAIQVEFAETNERVRDLEEQHQLLSEWKELPLKLSDLKTVSTRTLLLKSNTSAGDLAQTLTEKFSETAVVVEVTKVDSTHAALTVLQSADESTYMHVIESAGAFVVSAPEGTETPEVEFTAVSEKLAQANGHLGLLYDQAEHFAITHYKNLQIANEMLTWEKERYQSVENGAATAHTLMFDGWLNQMKRDKIEEEIRSQEIAAVVSEVALEENEQPPVDIVNSAFIQPFEAVTRLYGMPGYRDLDPTVFLAGFFFLFFGLSLTDVGYGLFLMVASVAILTLFKVSAAIRMFAKLLLFVGFSTVLVGLLFGGYLGFDPALLPAPLQALQLFDPIGNPLPVFYLALGLGVLQVMVGLMVKIYSDYKQGRVMEGVLDQGPWLFMFVLGILYLAVATGYVSFIGTGQIVNLAYVGIIMIILASGRKGDTIFGKVLSSAGALYSSIGYFSDILSYSRLLALGLATTALAFAVNLIAEIVSGSVPYLGPILGFLVLVIGHLFTLAVNTLGAFIHSARLQFVEFFGKFIEGTGKEFSPLSRTEKYVTIQDE